MQVHHNRQAFRKEQNVTTELKEEMQAVSDNAEEQIQAEQMKVQAKERERARVERALQAERQKVDAERQKVEAERLKVEAERQRATPARNPSLFGLVLDWLCPARHLDNIFGTWRP